MRILGVDDDDIALDILEAAVEIDGHELIRAQSVEEAIDLLRHEKIQFVISDWMMPGMDGIDLLRFVRKMNASRYTYFVLLTGRSERKDLLEGLDAGADDVIVKPFDAVELRLRLRVGQRMLSLETHQLTIFALAKLADTRDNETGKHLERIREYSRILAQHIVDSNELHVDVTGDYVELIYLTSPLHDIGKVGIPDRVLLKPGKLETSEYSVMKDHAAIGGHTLGSALSQFPDAAYLKMARDIAHHHHERYDGRGYPDGLVGTAIPLCARIVSIADVYDALVSQRVYKPAFTHESSCKIIIEGSGTQFDPIVVDAFKACEPLIKSVRDQLTEISYNHKMAA